MNSRIEPFRVGLAVATVFGLVLSMLLVLGGAPARADGDDSPATCSAMGGATSSSSITAPAGFAVSAICIKSGESSFGGLKHSGVITTDGTYGEGFVVVGMGTGSVTVTGGEHQVSHLDYRLGPVSTTTTVGETTTSAGGKTTTTAGETTTTAGETTTSAGETTTTTTIEDQVLGTVITTTTIADEVAGTQVVAEELPFTGVESDWLVPAAVLLLISGLMITGLAGRREV